MKIFLHGEEEDRECRYVQDAVDWKIFSRKTKEQKVFSIEIRNLKLEM